MSNERRAMAWPSWLKGAAGRELRRPPRLRRPRAVAWVGLSVAALLAGGCGSTGHAGNAGHAGHVTTLKATRRSRLLSVGNLPAGWSVAPVTSAKGLAQVATSPCGAALVGVLSPPGLPKSPVGPSYDTASFVEGTTVPDLRDTLASGAQAQEAWQRFDAALAGCRKATFVYKGTNVLATGNPIALGRLGRSSSAYAWTLRSAGAKVGDHIDVILFQTAKYDGYLSYSDVGPPSLATLLAFARAAVAKAANGSTAPVPDTVSIASAPVQTVHTALGTVAYRTIGNGPALVMINGYSATMEDWDPLLVDALAQHHRVVVFDNAGVGRSQSLPAPLTTDAMANQTGALIDALHLAPADVLGWSMGTTIAQALAVLHPSDVGALVLCAPYPGNGAVVLPPRKVLDATSDPTALFPANQTGAEQIYNLAISSYPKAPPASNAANSAQLHALHEWWAGGDPAGRMVAKIAVPTLLADGTADRLDPGANIHLLARLIHRATLELYPDAGHAFLYQDYMTVAISINSFLNLAKSSH
jgi:pimeloyl-ACP methyl ester carboxylesterase